MLWSRALHRWFPELTGSAMPRATPVDSSPTSACSSTAATRRSGSNRAQAYVTLGFAIAVVAAFTLAGGQPTPSAGMIVNGAAWVLVADAVVCILAVGLASLTGSRAVTLTALIGWELVVSPQLVTTASLGTTRSALIDGALLRIEPGPIPHGTPHLAMSIAAVIAVLVIWPLVATSLGAWRTRSRDA
jgi:hypothetical protein